MSYIFTPTTTQELKDVVDDWCRDKAEAEHNWGHISNWNTGRITKMNELFINKREFNDDISRWDVSNVTNMNRMFKGAQSFNQPIGNWDVSKVTNMGFMFEGAENFNQPVDGWNVSSAINMLRMFYGAQSFDQPIGGWNVSKVTNMSAMFSHTYFNQPIGGWNVSNVTNMSDMFHNAEFNQSIDNWNVSKVIRMDSMFNGNEKFNSGEDFELSNKPLNWNVSNVTNMKSMFADAESFNQPIGDWDVSNVTNMASMFYRTVRFNHPIGNWNVSKVTNMANMFDFTYEFDQPINTKPNVTMNGSTYTAWDVSKVTDMAGMFQNAEVFNQPIGDWDVSNVTNMASMFRGAVLFNQPIGNWNISNVRVMTQMFMNTESFDQPLGTWDISNVAVMQDMFFDAFALYSSRHNTVNTLPLQNWPTGGPLTAQQASDSDTDTDHEMEIDDGYIQPMHQGTGDDLAYEVHNATLAQQPLLDSIRVKLGEYFMKKINEITYTNISRVIGDEHDSLLMLKGFAYSGMRPGMLLDDFSIDHWRNFGAILYHFLQQYSSISQETTVEIRRSLQGTWYSNQDKNLFILTARSLLFICTDNFTPELQEIFFKNLVKDCASAYSSGMSCPTGIVERIPSTMQEIVTILCSGECSGIVDEIYQVWQSIGSGDDFDADTWITPHCPRLRELYNADDTTDKHIYKDQALQLIKEKNLPPGQNIEIYFSEPSLLENIKYAIGYDDIFTFHDYCDDAMDIAGGKKKRSMTRRKSKHKRSKRTTSKKTTKRPDKVRLLRLPSERRLFHRPSERRLFHRPKKSVKNKKKRTKKRATRKRN